ncbi:MAG: FHA domain-containing protein [Sedimentisphaerales bacterium]
MRLVIKQAGRTVNEFRFAKGPIYIGRHIHSQVFLPDIMVSRQHAVIYATQEGKWIVEDLDSANKTFLNDKAIHKAEIKTGNRLRIANFTIEINLEEKAKADKRIHLEDTLITTFREPQVIMRNLDTEQAPDIRLPAKRYKDFVQATEAICKAHGPDEVLKALLSIMSQQFAADHVWCALRNEPSGSMTCHAGKRRDGQAIKLSDIKFNEKINQAAEDNQFLLLPQVSEHIKGENIRSALIAPIVGAAGCFGVMYLDNDVDQEPYSLSDLDYLMLLAIHTAAILENF